MFRRVAPRLSSSFAGRSALRNAGPLPLDPHPCLTTTGTNIGELHEIVHSSSANSRLFGGSPVAALLSASGVSLFCVCFGVNILNAVVEATYREEEEDDDDDDDA
ncbi:Hypothetical protein, putative [Bodo saltans]|uniref:Uncharacterized protein n=1 Tax=Bodo saltans TaxID=75058 RepID=A0A0S4JUP1_BODSA|nr:Hypothetical protein, putative [Bodo saltans]|eukprot:CUG94293.1 Hypothetical protein, putative [Bodo saltans]